MEQVPEHDPVEMNLNIQLPGDDPVLLGTGNYATHHHHNATAHAPALRVESEHVMHISDPELRRYKTDGIDSDGSSHIIVQLQNSREHLPDPATFAPAAVANNNYPHSNTTASTNRAVNYNHDPHKDHEDDDEESPSGLTSTTRTTSSTNNSDEIIQPRTPAQSRQNSARTDACAASARLQPRHAEPLMEDDEDEDDLEFGGGVHNGGGVRNGGGKVAHHGNVVMGGNVDKSFDTLPISAAPAGTGGAGAGEKSKSTSSSLLSSYLEKPGAARWFFAGIILMILVAAGALAGIICGTGHCSSGSSTTSSDEAADGVIPNVPDMDIPTPPEVPTTISTDPPTSNTISTDPPTTTTLGGDVWPPKETTSPTQSPTTAAPVTTDPPTTVAPPTEPPTAPETLPIPMATEPATVGPTELIPNLPPETLAAMGDIATPQGKAYMWVQSYPNFAALPDWRKRQLFALATFYRAFNGHNWPLGRRYQWLDANVNEVSDYNMIVWAYLLFLSLANPNTSLLV